MAVRTSCLLLALTGACGFQVSANGGNGGGDGGPDSSIDSAIDAPIDTPAETGDVDLIPASEETFNTGNWTVDDLTIDTSALTSSIPLPAGVSLLVGIQTSGGQVAFLRVNDFKLNSGRTMRVVGQRPFVILANHDITIDGTLDISARGKTPGAGGQPPATGPGKGGDGTHVDTSDESGGGGGGFGSVGGSGGPASTAAGGAPGASYAIAFLAGGSGGGGPAPGIGCTNVGGGGGGAILIYAKHKLTIQGAINAGGGGGEAGVVCTNPSNHGAGAGGGAGGTIHLQTPDLNGNGILAANGGGGGGPSCTTGAITPGEDGKASTTLTAFGGIGNGCGPGGGNGAVGTMAAGSALSAGFNGGGGGGGTGRIKINAPGTISVMSSPPAVVVTQ